MVIKEKIFNKIIFFLFTLLFFLTPLIMNSITSELFEFNKMIFIYFITSLILFFWIGKMIFLNKIIMKKTFLDFFIILFLLSQILSTVFSIDIHTSLFGYYGRFNGGLLSIISYIILYYAFVSNLNKDAFLKLLRISIITSFIVILWGLPGKVGYDLSCLLFTGQLNNSCWTEQFKPAERMFSTLGQPNWLGAYLAINFFIGLYFFIKSNSKISDGFYLSYLFLNFSSILFTRSRSAFISVIFGLIFLIFFQLFFNIKTGGYKKLHKCFSKILFLFFIFLISVLLFKTGIEKIDRFLKLDFVTKKNSSQNQTTTTQFTPNIKVTESFDIRKIVWQGAIDLGKRYPLFGTGVETFAYAYYFVRPVEHNLTSEWDYLYNKAHNEFLNYLATTGFFGLGSYLMLILFFILNSFKNLNTNREVSFLKVCLLSSYFTILITNFFGFSTTTINLFFYLIPAFTFILQQKEGLKEEEIMDFQVKKLNSIQIFFGLILVFFIFSALIFIGNYWYADTLYAKADVYQKTGYYKEALSELQKALKLKYEHVYQDKLSYLLANFAYVIFKPNLKSEISQLISASKFYNEQSLKASPKNVIYYKTRAKIFYIFYQITMDKSYLINGIKTLDIAFKLSPTDPKIPYTQSIFYSLLADEVKNKKEKELYQNYLLSNLDLAIKLKPDYRDAYFLKGKFLKTIGRKNDAKKIFEYILKNISPNDQEVKEELKNL